MRWFRVAAALLTFGTFGYNIASRWDAPEFSLANMLSFFTIQSNLIAAVVLLVAAARTGRPPSMRFELVRGAAVLYLVTTGVVYAVLLSGYDAIAQVTPPLVNVVMHLIMPIVIVVDWLLAPPRVRLPWRGTLLWLAYPLAYLVYTLIRGPLVDWYPYPFLDPVPLDVDYAGSTSGYVRVAMTCIVIAAGLVVLELVIRWVGEWRSGSVRETPDRIGPVAGPGRS